VNVKLKAFANLRELLGKELTISVSAGETIRGLLRVVGSKHHAFEAQVLDGGGHLRPYVNILHNGRNIRFLNELDTTLAEGDVVAIFPPVAGG
jgi:molybdopterin synthase sulfur carrier subunit